MKKSPSQIPEKAIGVTRLGFEPKTHSLEGCCSIQLSYRADPFVSGLCNSGRAGAFPWNLQHFRKVDAKVCFFYEFYKWNFI